MRVLLIKMWHIIDKDDRGGNYNEKRIIKGIIRRAN